jgi:hypothetical protein
VVIESSAVEVGVARRSPGMYDRMTEPQGTGGAMDGGTPRHEEPKTRVEPADERDLVDEASEDSFPASDPPAFEPLHTGPPGVHPDSPAKRSPSNVPNELR